MWFFKVQKTKLGLDDLKCFANDVAASGSRLLCCVVEDADFWRETATTTTTTTILIPSSKELFKSLFDFKHIKQQQIVTASCFGVAILSEAWPSPVTHFFAAVFAMLPSLDAHSTLSKMLCNKTRT